MQREEKGVTIRQPATANLMIDSADRNSNVNPSAFDFQISRNNSILNGFFSRIGTTEVVLEWNEPNGAYLAPISTNITLPGGSVSTVTTEFGSLGFYTAEQALGHLCSTVSTVGGGLIITPNSNNGTLELGTFTGSNFDFDPSPSLQKLGLIANIAVPSLDIGPPDLRPFRYLDFVSQQLTYNQELKDTATNTSTRDVLCRWYMAWDNPPTYDGLGFPILQGYTPFTERRLFNPPKQIKWEPNMPIGNIAFQVFGNNTVVPISDLVPVDNNGSQWLMTLQVSEN